MTSAERNNYKNVLMLTLTSVVMSVLFSFLGAPFLRALSVTAKPKTFWLSGVILTAALYTAGFALESVYISAIWMTLGLYNEFEKRGINWRKAGLGSLVTGILFATMFYVLMTKYSEQKNILSDVLTPLQLTVNKAFPDSPVEVSTLMSYVPGIFSAMLLSSLAIGFMLEGKVNKLFNLRQTRVATALKWLEFRLPDLFIWTSLFAAFFSLVPVGYLGLQKMSLNFVIVSVVAFFFQGLAVTEFLTKVFRFGPFSKMILYILIVLQLAPAIILIGLVDYWVDFRKRLRKKLKVN